MLIPRLAHAVDSQEWRARRARLLLAGETRTRRTAAVRSLNGVADSKLVCGNPRCVHVLIVRTASRHFGFCGNYEVAARSASRSASDKQGLSDWRVVA